MGRGGRPKAREEPERRCLVSGESGPKARLIRFVASPAGEVVPDVAGKLPGRGFYVSANRAAIEAAARRRLFSRGAKASVVAPEGLADQVEALLLRRVQEGVALARKAGLAVTGYEKVRGWLQTGEAAVLVQASDASERGRSKLNTPPGGSYVGCLTAEELGAAFGRAAAVHAALATGALTRRVVEDGRKLSGLRCTTQGRPASGRREGSDVS